MADKWDIEIWYVNSQQLPEKFTDVDESELLDCPYRLSLRWHNDDGDIEREVLIPNKQIRKIELIAK